MITVVCVYNDEDVLRRRLAAGLEEQDARVPLVAVDNRRGAFASAVAALHHGAAAATTEWVAFVHQDVRLLSSDWTTRAAALVESADGLGWAGVAGVDASGAFRGLLRDSGMVRGRPLAAPAPVQTLDECVLITRRRPDGRYFDDGLEGWHAYGVDACLTAATAGRTNVVLPLPVWHDSPATNRSGLGAAHAWVWEKHRGNHPRIHTTTGTLPEGLRADAGAEGLAVRVARRARALGLRVRGYEGGYRVWCGETLEDAVAAASRVDVLRPVAPVAPLEAAGFVYQPAVDRSIVHRFDGLDASTREGATVVVHQDLAAREVEHDGGGRLAALVEAHPDAVVVCPAAVRDDAPDIWARLVEGRRVVLALDDERRPVLVSLPDRP